MYISFRDFVSICPSAMMPDEEIFNAVKPMFDDRFAFLKGVLTDSVFEKIFLEDYDLRSPDGERLDSMRKAVKKYVCASAYYLAIPQLDLVLTPTGFGVVNNQNVAPASADRVKALRAQIDIQSCLYFDEIIDLARPFVDWGQSSLGHVLFSSLFWRGVHMRWFGISQPTRHDLIERIPDIDYAGSEIARKLSPELYKALRDAESKDCASSSQKILITFWRRATVAHSRNDGSFIDFVSAMLRFVEDNIDDFPEYRDSHTYQANHFKPYENEQNDSCFFFG